MKTPQQYRRYNDAIARGIKEHFAGMEHQEAALAQRKANSPLMAPKPQIPCDHGLFSDEKDQLDLADMPMFHDAIEEE